MWYLVKDGNTIKVIFIQALTDDNKDSYDFIKDYSGNIVCDADEHFVWSWFHTTIAECAYYIQLFGAHLL